MHKHRVRFSVIGLKIVATYYYRVSCKPIRNRLHLYHIKSIDGIAADREQVLIDGYGGKLGVCILPELDKVFLIIRGRYNFKRGDAKVEGPTSFSVCYAESIVESGGKVCVCGKDHIYASVCGNTDLLLHCCDSFFFICGNTGFRFCRYRYAVGIDNMDSKFRPFVKYPVVSDRNSSGELFQILRLFLFYCIVVITANKQNSGKGKGGKEVH